jgi:hypothetical protein
MEPRREEPKHPKARPEERPRRFPIVKLEERIGPKKLTSGTINLGGLSIE